MLKYVKNKEHLILLHNVLVKFQHLVINKNKIKYVFHSNRSM